MTISSYTVKIMYTSVLKCSWILNPRTQNITLLKTMPSNIWLNSVTFLQPAKVDWGHMSFHRRFRSNGVSCTGAMGYLVLGDPPFVFFQISQAMGCGTCFCLLVNSCKLMISVEREIYRVNLNVYIYVDIMSRHETFRWSNVWSG